MYWGYDPYWYWYYPMAPVAPLPNFLYLMSTMLLWMMYPYYYALYFEVLRTALETWRKVFESLYKGIAPTST